MPPIGEWREHLPYNSAIDVTADDTKVWCATPYSLFSVETSTNTIERYSRVTGLSETGISTIKYDETNKKLFIAYQNSNIDIIYRNDIINIPDVMRDDIAGNKEISQVYPFRNDYYLSTGLGIIIIDGTANEVKDTWFIGSSGGQLEVNGVTTDATHFYAATEEGLKRASINGPDPADFNNWQLLGGNNGLTAGACQNILNFSNQLVVEKNDSLFAFNGTSWNLFYADGWNIVSSNVSGGKLLLCQRNLSEQGKVTILNSNGTIDRVLQQLAPVSFPRKAIMHEGDPWLADQYGGLTHFTAASYEQYKPNSPEATASGELVVRNNVVYATAGEVNEAWNYQYNGNGIFVLRDGNWNNINRFRFPQIDSLLDYITVAIDPRDESIWAGSYGGGLLQVKPDETFRIYKQDLLGAAIGDPASYRVSGLSFDAENNLWISNFGAPQPLIVLKPDGTSARFSLPVLLGENSLAQILVDENNYKWIVVAKTGSILLYDHGGSLESIGDDRWKFLGPGTGNGNLPEGAVLCVAEDKSGFIWVGTTNGVGVIQCPADIFTAQACEAIRPIVQQGNFAGYLFNGEEVRSIAVDAADRKWVATRNGVFLVSATGENLVYQFTEQNSPLLSNDVKKIAIDGKTGEVFFATLKGICSFRSTATEGRDGGEQLLVFPNPVPPGYSGSIGIRGVVNNAIVKVTELNGRLVWQGRAFGGQAVWDGRDYRGNEVSTGVYLVLVSEDGTSGRGKKETAAGKIVFIGR